MTSQSPLNEKNNQESANLFETRNADNSSGASLASTLLTDSDLSSSEDKTDPIEDEAYYTVDTNIFRDVLYLQKSKTRRTSSPSSLSQGNASITNPASTSNQLVKQIQEFFDASDVCQADHPCNMNNGTTVSAADHLSQIEKSIIAIGKIKDKLETAGGEYRNSPTFVKDVLKIKQAVDLGAMDVQGELCETYSNQNVLFSSGVRGERAKRHQKAQYRALHYSQLTDIADALYNGVPRFERFKLSIGLKTSKP